MLSTDVDVGGGGSGSGDGGGAVSEYAVSGLSDAGATGALLLDQVLTTAVTAAAYMHACARTKQTRSAFEFTRLGAIRLLFNNILLLFVLHCECVA